MSRKTLVTITVITLVISFVIYYQVHYSSKLQKDGIYTIITLENMKAGGKGCELDIYIYYNYMNIEHKNWSGCFSSTELPVNPIGKRYFMKFTPNKKGNIEGYIHILFHYPVPDTLQAPPEGWSQTWMQKHFPNCIE